MKVVIAGGGTGGHLFPGVAVAEEIMGHNSTHTVVFVGTSRGIEAREVPKLGYPLELVAVSGIKTVGIWGGIRGLARIPGALWQCRGLLKRLAPDVVLGVGGYASGPVVFMARWLGIRTAVLEQNSIPGITNRILSRVAHRCFLSFASSQRYFPNAKSELVGNPIRAQIRNALVSKTAAAPPVGDPNHPGIALFIFGGSQGARAVNRLVVDAVAELARAGIAVRGVHQTGAVDLAATREGYRSAGVATIECHEFIDDMATQYRSADLVIARAGATTIAELGVVGKPALLIPYPHAANNHQEHNALELVAAKAALMLREQDATASEMATLVIELATHRDQLEKMASAMRSFGRPNAASRVAAWCQEADAILEPKAEP